MKGTKLEKLVLGHILIRPAMIKDIDINRDFFTFKKMQLVYDEIISGNTDPILISKKVKFDDAFTYVSSLSDGVPRSDWKNVPKYINEVKVEKLKIEVTQRVDQCARSGYFDHEKIKAIYNQIESLEIPKEKHVSRSLDQFDPIPIQWFWYNKIPSGALSFLVGDPGAGKSLLSLYMAASVSKGNDWPDVNLPPGSKPGSVIILTAEDNVSDTVRVRCDEMGADVKKIIIFEGILSSGSDFFDIRRHLNLLEREIKRLGDVKLIVFDPITAYMGGTEGNRNIQVRAALAPLKDVAETNDLSIIGINHMNKNQAQKALYRTMGSVAFTAAARATWLVALDEDDPHKTRRFFVPLQTNICKNPTSLSFSVDGPLGRPSVSFDPVPSDVTAADLLADEETKERNSSLGQAIKFLSEALKEGPVESELIKKWALENSISERTLERAKSKMNTKSYQEKRKWYIELIK